MNVTRRLVADILLVLDHSTSIRVEGGDTYRHWRVVLDFASCVAGAFRIARNQTQVAVMKFSTKAEVVFYLNKHRDRASLLKAIGKIRHEGGNTNLAEALRRGREVYMTSNGARSKVPKILIMLTDGTATHEVERTQEEATNTKADGITIFTVGVGGGVNKDELEKIASKPEYFFFATDFADLRNILEKLLMSTTTTTTTSARKTTTTESCKLLQSLMYSKFR